MLVPFCKSDVCVKTVWTTLPNTLLSGCGIPGNLSATFLPHQLQSSEIYMILLNDLVLLLDRQPPLLGNQKAFSSLATFCHALLAQGKFSHLLFTQVSLPRVPFLPWLHSSIHFSCEQSARYRSASVSPKQLSKQERDYSPNGQEWFSWRHFLLIPGKEIMFVTSGTESPLSTNITPTKLQLFTSNTSNFILLKKKKVFILQFVDGGSIRMIKWYQNSIGRLPVACKAF